MRRPSIAVKPRGVVPGGRPQANVKTERHAARESRGQKVKEDKVRGQRVESSLGGLNSQLAKEANSHL